MCSLHDQGPRNWRGINPLLLLVQYLESLNVGFLPEDSEALGNRGGISPGSHLHRTMRRPDILRSYVKLASQMKDHQKTRGATLLGVGPNANDSIVNRARLRRIVQNAHDRSCIFRLLRRSVSEPRSSHPSTHLVGEEVLRKVERKGEEWEELAPEVHSCVAADPKAAGQRRAQRQRTQWVHVCPT